MRGEGSDDSRAARKDDGFVTSAWTPGCNSRGGEPVIGCNSPVRPALKPQSIPTMKIKSALPLLAALGCLTLATVSLSAQTTTRPAAAADDSQTGSETGGRGRGGRGGAPGAAATPDAQVQRLNGAVTMTDEQKAKVLAIYKDEATKLQALRDDTKLTPEARMAKMQEIQTATRASVRALLTADQQKKFDAMPAGGAGGRGNRGGQGGGGGGGRGQGGGGGAGGRGRGAGGGGGGSAN